MDLSKLNPAEWIKNIFKELENIKYCYFLAFFGIYSLLLLLPDNLVSKLQLFKYISFLSLFAILSLVILLGRSINIISSMIEKFFYEKKSLKYLNTLNPDEKRTLSLGVILNQQTVFLDDITGITLINKGLIKKCEGKQNNESTFPYIIPNFVWEKIVKDPKFKEMSIEEILRLNNERNGTNKTLKQVQGDVREP